MTEKQYVSMLNEYGESYGILNQKNNEELISTSKILNEMNELNDENQYLKSLKWNQDCINEISICIQQIQSLEERNNKLAEKNKQLRFDFKEMKDLLHTLEEENNQFKIHIKELVHEAIIEILDGQRYEGERILKKALELLE